MSYTTNSPQALKEHLNHLATTHQKLEHLTEHLERLISVLAMQQSWFSRASIYWGTQSIWVKTGAGISLAWPFFLIGFTLQAAPFITLSVFISITYTACSLLLDNHHQQLKHDTQRLKQGILKVAQMLKAVIYVLDTVQQQLTIENDKIHQENSLLTTHIVALKNQIHTLSHHIQQIEQSSQNLESSQKELYDALRGLKQSLAQQSVLLSKRQNQLDIATQNMHQSQHQFRDTITQVHRVKNFMHLEIENHATVAALLQVTLTSLTDMALLEQQQNTVFFNQMEQFIEDKQARFERITHRMGAIVQRLNIETKDIRRIKEELLLRNESYKELLVQQDQHIDRLTQLSQESTNTPAQTVYGHQTSILKNIGFYALNGHPEPSNQTLNHVFAVYSS